MSRVLLKSAGVDESAIKIRTEDVIHQGLECDRFIREAKGEHNELIW